MTKLIIYCSILFSFVTLIYPTNAVTKVNVIQFGAKPDGKTDSTQSFLKAWAAVCTSAQASTMYVPEGRFLVKTVVFRGSCKNKITVQIDGTIVAPQDYRSLGKSGIWILFIKVDRVSVVGGTFDARGDDFWNCRKSKKSCPGGARSIEFNWANDISISGLTSINSQLTHLVINACNNAMVRNVKLSAPADSPNTDGIHVQGSTGVTISDATLKTGDDCISIGPGTKNLWMEGIKCGPGHGVSIGSLGKDKNEPGVQNVTLINSAFTGSDNGLRIKAWARPTNSFVRNVLYQNVVMNNVKNAIIIDQNYCPNDKGCPQKSSGVKISGITYKNVQGTSATQIAVAFDCSPSNPCSGVRLQDVKLSYLNKDAQSRCKNIDGTTSGVSMPNSCLKS